MRKIAAVSVIFIIGIAIAVFMISESQSKNPTHDINRNTKPDCFISSSSISQYKLPLNNIEICESHVISDFKLINQLGDSVDIGLINNKITVVDFFFVSCTSICPKMNLQLKRIHDHYIDNEKVLLLSHTVWPEIDSAEVLFNYAESYGANFAKWQFLTGDKKELYRMARFNYLVVPDINDPKLEHGGEADFIHTENVVLIDTKKRIRGIYDGISSKDIDRLMKDIDHLLSEE